MAKIPSLVDSPRINMDVPRDPTMSPSEAGAPYRQMAQTAQNIGDGLMQLRKQQINEANKVAYTKSNIQFKKGLNEEVKQLDLQFQGSNYDGYAAAGLERMEQRRDAILEEAPESARDSIKLAFDEKMATLQGRLNTIEANKKSEYARFETQDQIKMAAETSYQTYDPEETIDTTRKLQNLIGGSRQYDSREKAVLAEQVADVQKDMIEGVLDRGDLTEMSRLAGDPDRGVAGDIDDPDLQAAFSTLDSKTKQKFKNRIHSKIKSKKLELAREIKGKASDLLSGYANGTINPLDPSNKEISRNIKNELVTVMGDDALPIIDEIETNERVFTVAKDRAFDIANFDPAAEAKDISSDIPDKLTRMASEGRALKTLKSQRASMMEELEKDPATYISKYDASIGLKTQEIIASRDASPGLFKDYMNSVDSRYDELGVPLNKRKYLAEPLKKHFGESVNEFIDAGDPVSAATVLNELSAKSGEEIYRFYDELDIPENYAAVTEVQDPTARIKVMTNIMNEKTDINPRFKELGESEDDIKNDLRENPLYRAILGQDAGKNIAAGSNAEAMLKAATIEYKAARLSGAEPEEARKKAWSRLGSGYDVIDNGNFPIPVRKSKYKSHRIKNFIDNYTKADDVDYVQEFNLQIPDKYTREEVNDSLSEASTFVYNKKSDSLRLLYYNKKAAKYQQAKFFDGQPAIIPMSEINNRDDLAESRAALNARRNIFQVQQGFSGQRPKKPEGMSFKMEGVFGP